MWNDGKSIRLSRIAIIIFMVLLVATAVFAPSIVHKTFMNTDMARWNGYFLFTIYIGCIPAALLLISLFRTLGRIEKGDVFIPKNVESLRNISWYCFAGAVISAVSVGYYFPWVMVAISAAFMGLIVRIVKNIIAKAVSLQDDANLTI